MPAYSHLDPFPGKMSLLLINLTHFRDTLITSMSSADSNSLSLRNGIFSLSLFLACWRRGKKSISLQIHNILYSMVFSSCLRALDILNFQLLSLMGPCLKTTTLTFYNACGSGGTQSIFWLSKISSGTKCYLLSLRINGSSKAQEGWLTYLYK